MKKLTLLLIFLLALPFAANAEEYLYVMSARAKLLSNPAFGSKTIENLTKGEKVITLEKKNNWFKVRYGNNVGWMSRLSVSPHPPVKRRHRLASADSKLKNNSRRRASNVSTTAAVRGLKDLERSRLNAKDVMDFSALAKMESVSVSDGEVYAFMEGLTN